MYGMGDWVQLPGAGYGFSCCFSFDNLWFLGSWVHWQSRLEQANIDYLLSLSLAYARPRFSIWETGLEIWLGASTDWQCESFLATIIPEPRQAILIFNQCHAYVAPRDARLPAYPNAIQWLSRSVRGYSRPDNAHALQYRDEQDVRRQGLSNLQAATCLWCDDDLTLTLVSCSTDCSFLQTVIDLTTLAVNLAYWTLSVFIESNPRVQSFQNGEMWRIPLESAAWHTSCDLVRTP